MGGSDTGRTMGMLFHCTSIPDSEGLCGAKGIPAIWREGIGTFLITPPHARPTCAKK